MDLNIIIVLLLSLGVVYLRIYPAFKRKRKLDKIKEARKKRKK